ncbi:alpha/beta hydrolase [Sphingomonas sabuli]|uniref:Alpha/beta hydrolase n=1 Tax=Sphingomonas sabuli TaxID=2764186 RepID=A0A7G9L1R2_9SPHN|nr:alpha/beta hydrolase [Sphingomonas sabuli]QNM82561.1 alpha/beta hydrolase [Sphingomonas sabuli]
MIGLALFALAAAAPASAASPDLLARLKLEPCDVAQINEATGGPAAAVAGRCGTFVVPENRSVAGGRMLTLKTVVIPAKSAEPRAPIFFFSGGPGQASTDQAQYFGELGHRQNHDLVFVDLRGTAVDSGLDCGLEGSDADPQSYLRPFLSAGVGYAACRDRLQSIADLTQYNTTISMQDVDELRKALGYRQINIVGGSYGTRAAIEYIRLFPDAVHAAALYSLVPPESRSPLDHAPASQRALDLAFEQCRAQPACKAAYPDLETIVPTLMAQLKAKPAEVVIPHPATKAPITVTLTDAAFAGALRVMLYGIDQQRRIPLLLHRAKSGDFVPFATAAMNSSRGFSKALRVGLLLSVACSEDSWRIAPDEPARMSRGTFLGTARTTGQLAACSVWPKGRPPAGFYDPPVSQVPVVLVSGQLDPVTPPSLGEIARKRFPNSVHIIAPFGTHVPNDPSFDRMEEQLFSTGSVAGLAEVATMKAESPPFALPDSATE